MPEPDNTDFGEVELDPRVGTLLGERYRIDALIGEGGMGKIYAAEHVLMRKKVAVKILHHRLTGMPDVVSRFEREAMAAANIDDPHIAVATDFGKLPDGAVFLVLEYIDGVGLREAMDFGPLPTARALHIARQIAGALASAHALDIVHRDLKPENVMLVQKGSDPDFVKVLDFGIARVPIGDGGDRAKDRAGKGPITRIGTVFGTPEYMPPEQALGHTVDARADLYSLGVILFEMLAGVRPYVAGTPTGLLGQQLVQKPPKFSARAPEVSVPPEVEQIVERLLAREADERFQSATEVVLALSTALGLPIPSSAPTTDPPSSVGPRSFPRNNVYDTEIRAPGISSAPPSSGQAAAPSAVKRWFGRAPKGALGALSFGLGALALLGLGAFIARLDATPEPPRAVESGSAPIPTSHSIPTSQTPARPEATPGAPALPTTPPKPAPLPLPKELSALEGLLQKDPARGDAAAELARIYAERRDYKQAAERAALALEGDRELSRDPRIASALFQAVQSKAARETSFSLLEGPMGSRGADILYDLAVDARVAQVVRERARRFIESPAFARVASPALTVAVALRNARACPERRALLPRASAQGDLRSLRYLEEYLERTGCGPGKSQDCSACLRSDSALDDAIFAIKQRSTP